MEVAAATPPPPPPVPAAATAAREESDQSFSGGASSTMPAAPAHSTRASPSPNGLVGRRSGFTEPGRYGDWHWRGGHSQSRGDERKRGRCRSGHVQCQLRRPDGQRQWRRNQIGRPCGDLDGRSEWHNFTLQFRGLRMGSASERCDRRSSCRIGARRRRFAGSSGAPERSSAPLTATVGRKSVAPVSDDLVDCRCDAARLTQRSPTPPVLRFATSDGGLTWRPQ